MTKQPKTTEVEWTSISLTIPERDRWKARADKRGHLRSVRNEIMNALDAIEELEKDIDADMQTRIDEQKAKREEG